MAGMLERFRCSNTFYEVSVSQGGNPFGQIKGRLDFHRLISIFGLEYTLKTYLNPQFVLAFVFILIN